MGECSRMSPGAELMPKHVDAETLQQEDPDPDQREEAGKRDPRSAMLSRAHCLPHDDSGSDEAHGHAK
jgi:hypothetical protein